jgi:hypothetical protein
MGCMVALLLAFEFLTGVSVDNWNLFTVEDQMLGGKEKLYRFANCYEFQCALSVRRPLSAAPFRTDHGNLSGSLDSYRIS